MTLPLRMMRKTVNVASSFAASAAARNSSPFFTGTSHLDPVRGSKKTTRFNFDNFEAVWILSSAKVPVTATVATATLPAPRTLAALTSAATPIVVEADRPTSLTAAHPVSNGANSASMANFRPAGWIIGWCMRIDKGQTPTAMTSR